MPSNWPGAKDTFTTGTLTGVVSGSDHGNKADAINKMQDTVGVGATNGRLKVVQEAPLNVRWPDYGAVGGSAAADKAAFAAAAAAIPATGGEIFVPPAASAYLVDSVALKPKTRIFSDYGAVVKLTNAAPAVGSVSPHTGHRVIFVNANATTTGDEGIVIEGIKFDGNHTNATNASNECYPVTLFGVRGAKLLHTGYKDCGRAGIIISVSVSSFVQNEDVTLLDTRLEDVGRVGGWGGIGVISCDRLIADGITCKRSADYAIDLEPNQTTVQRFRNCIITNVSAEDVGSGVVVNCQAADQAQDTLISGVTLRDGPNVALARAVRITYSTRTIVRDVTSDYIYNAEAVFVENSLRTTLAQIIAVGSNNGGSGPAVQVKNSFNTLLTGSDLPSAGGQTYALQETTGSDNTVVTGNNRLAGSTGPVAFTGTSSRLRDVLTTSAAQAPNVCTYVDSTSGKLVFKDAAGTSTALY